MEKNFTETKENCQNASNLHFDLKSSQVEAESMSTNEATIMEKDLNIPKNDPKNTSPKVSHVVFIFSLNKNIILMSIFIA